MRRGEERGGEEGEEGKEERGETGGGKVRIGGVEKRWKKRWKKRINNFDLVFYPLP